MQLTTIPFEKTGKFSKLILDYINSPENLSDFVDGEVSLQNFKNKLSEKSFPNDKRELLVKRLQSQYKCSGIEVPANVSLLLHETTFTVTTGHQLCLLGGPQYFIHKIVSTIKLSQQLKEAYPESDFVPVFWLASEDHDFEEINNVSFFGKHLKTETNYSGPVGRLDANIFSSIIQELNEILGDSQNDNDLRSLFTDAYSVGSLSDATRTWVHGLFEKFGLVIVDGNTYSVLNTNLTFSEAEILALLESNPEKFSPNAVMRPVYEEVILPNLAYVGGPGEIAYWMQLKGNFERLEVDFPLLVVRDSFLIPNSKQLYPFLDMGFELEDVFRGEHELLKEFLKRNSDKELHFEKEEAILKELNQALLEKIEGVDNSLSGMVNAELNKVNKLFEKLESKLIKAQKRKEEVSVNKIVKFRDSILPNDVLVERFESFIPTYLRFGEEYIKWLIDCSNVLDSKLKVIVV